VQWRDDGEELEALLIRIKRGDPRAWSRVVERFQNLVYSSARRVGLSAEDSEDVFVAVFQAFLTGADRIESGKTLPKWFAVTSSRIALRQARASRKTVNLEEPATLELLVADEEDRADAIAERSILSDKLRQGIEALAEKCRQLLRLLYYEEDASYEEVSQRLSMPIGAIGPNKARCLEKLRRSLAKDGVIE